MLWAVTGVLLGPPRGGAVNVHIFSIGARACAALSLVVLLLAASPGLAADDVQEVRWFHADPDAVRTFVLRVADGPEATAPSREIEVGKPSSERTETGAFFSAMIVMDLDEVVAVSAIGKNGLASAPSAWGKPTPSPPGQPLVLEP